MRTAEKQPEVFPLNSGMNQSFGDRAAPFGTLTLVKNSRIDGGGLVKRCGSAAVSKTTDNFRALADHADSARPTEKASFIARLGQQKLAGASSGWAFVHDGTDWGFAGEFSAAQPVRRRVGIEPTVPTAPLGPYMPGCATNSSGYVCTAAGFGSELRITVTSPTGRVLYRDVETIGAANIIVRVVPVVNSTTQFYVLYQATNGTALARKIVSIDDGEAGVTTGATLLTLANAASKWDASYYDGTTWFVVYQSGATTVTVAELNTSGAVGSTATFTTTDNLTYLSIWADAVTDRVWVGVVDDPTGTPAMHFRVYTDALSLETGPESISTSGTVGPPLFGPLYKRTPVAGDAFGVFADSNANIYFTQTLVVEAGSLTRQRTLSGIVPVGKPDFGNRVWVMTYSPVSNFSITRGLLLRFVGAEFIGESSNDPTPIVELATPDMEHPGSTYHPAAQPGSAFHACAVTTESAGGEAFFALPFVLTSRTNASGSTEPTTRADVYEYTRQNQEPHRQFVPLGLSGVVTGQPTELYGTLSVHTSDCPSHGGVEIGFAHAPAFESVTATPSGSGLAAGTYLYYAVQQWVDDEGNRHLSPPSAPYSLELAVPSSVEIDVTNCYVGQRPNIGDPIASQSPTTLLYRTAAGGTEAQLVPIAMAETAGSWAGFVRGTDTVADAVIDDNEFLYTAGGVLPNVLAPSCRYLAVSEERLWCGGLWDSNLIECSKIKVPGEPYNFTGHASHQVVIPGEVSGLAYMDGQVCAFTEDAIYLVGGDGPNDQGAGGFAPPRALVRGIGCPRTQSASILETELGIIFRSTLGFYLIPRGFGTPQYIGLAVEDEDEIVLSAATTTTSAYRLARFLVCADGETKGDTVLTLDLTSLQWFRDEYTVNGTTTGQGFSEIGEWPAGLALMSYGLDRTDNANVVWAESESLTGDAGAAGAGATTYISQYARTAWIYPWGPLGYGRLTEVVMSMEAIGSSSLVTLTVETDSNTAETPNWTITTSESVSYRARSVKEPACTCFRLTVEDAAGASNSAGVRFLALGLQTQELTGIRRVTDSERQ